MTDVSVLLWQGLLADSPDLTLGEVQDMLDLAKAPQIAEAIYQAWNAAAAPAEPVQAGGGIAAGPLSSSGDASGLMGASSLASATTSFGA